nr:TrkA C-terminal domain-containing protein [Terrisporobacter petrolearius]
MYQEGKSTKLMEICVVAKSNFANKTIGEADIPDEILVVMIKRKGEIIIPNGSTEILPNDILVITGTDISDIDKLDMVNH